VHPREVFQSAVLIGACGVIVGHNHPSGDPSPSPEDRAVTRRLADAGKLIGVPLLDSVVWGSAAAYVSLREIAPELFSSSAD
jgi:DNA repair protein RadC